MRTGIAFAALGLLLPTITVARQQTVDDVIEKHLEAIGGRAALGRVMSRTSIGTVTIARTGGDLAGSIESYAKVPNRTRTVMTFDLSARGLGQMTIDQRFDGTNGVIINSLQGTAQIPGDQLEDMRSGTFPSTLMTYKQQGLRAELLPSQEMDGHAVVVLALTPRKGPTVRMFLDANTYLLSRTIAVVSVPQIGEMEVRTEFLDYRVVDGVKVAFKTVTTNPQQTVTIAFTKIEQNAPLDDSTFVKK